jgi:DNA-binding XRE family transcriptional regulator
MKENFEKELTEAKSKLYETIRNAEEEYLQLFYDQISEIYIHSNKKNKYQIAGKLEGIINLFGESKEINTDLIKNIRKNEGYTQRAIAGELKIKTQAITDVEKGINLRDFRGKLRSNVTKYLDWLRDKGYKDNEKIT